MCVSRRKHPKPQVLQLGMRHHRRHHDLADAATPLGGVDEDVGHVTERCLIGDHPGEANRRALFDRSETERAAHCAIEHRSGHLSGPKALSRQPFVDAFEVDAGNVGRDLDQAFMAGR